MDPPALCFPSGFPMEVLDVMRERSNVCNYLDMPLQHGSTRMLTRMRRGITQEKTEALVDTIREKGSGHRHPHHAHQWFPR
jgi:ribosomal protein S12 methylthiotransferase